MIASTLFRWTRQPQPGTRRRRACGRAYPCRRGDRGPRRRRPTAARRQRPPGSCSSHSRSSWRSRSRAVFAWPLRRTAAEGSGCERPGCVPGCAFGGSSVAEGMCSGQRIRYQGQMPVGSTTPSRARTGARQIVQRPAYGFRLAIGVSPDEGALNARNRLRREMRCEGGCRPLVWGRAPLAPPPRSRARARARATLCLPARPPNPPNRCTPVSRLGTGPRERGHGRSRSGVRSDVSRDGRSHGDSSASGSRSARRSGSTARSFGRPAAALLRMMSAPLATMIV